MPDDDFAAALPITAAVARAYADSAMNVQLMQSDRWDPAAVTRAALPMLVRRRLSTFNRWADSKVRSSRRREELRC